MNLTVQLLDYLPFLLYQDFNFRLKGDKCHFYKNLTVPLFDYPPFTLYQDFNFRLKGDKCHFYMNNFQSFYHMLTEYK